MANPRYNTQTTNRRGAMGGGRMKKMGGGMTRNMYSKGSNGKKKNKKKAFGMLSVKAGIDKNPNPTQADRMMAKKGSIPPQLKKFVMAKKKKAKMKKNKKKVIG